MSCHNISWCHDEDSTAGQYHVHVGVAIEGYHLGPMHGPAGMLPLVEEFCLCKKCARSNLSHNNLLQLVPHPCSCVVATSDQDHH